MNPGGAEHVIATLSNLWSKNHQISILIFHDMPSFYPLNENIKLVRMNLSFPCTERKRFFFLPWIEWKRLRFFVKYVHQNHFDCILSFTETSSFLAMLGTLFYGIQPVLVSERNDPSSYPIWLQKIILFLYRHAHGVICQNEYVKNYYIKHGFKMPLSVLPNPVDFKHIPTGTSLVKRREIVTVGRLNPQKNQALLIDAFSEISAKYPEYTLKIYGVGPLKNILQQRIKELNLENRIFLMGTKKRVMSDVQQSDIFVLSSDFEGFPNVLIEAMASGMPVISSDFPTGVARKLIKNGENGYLFPVGDKAALVQALTKMLSCPDQWKHMGQRNHQIAQQYTAEKVAAGWLDTINKMLEEKSNPTFIK